MPASHAKKLFWSTFDCWSSYLFKWWHECTCFFFLSFKFHKILSNRVNKFRLQTKDRRPGSVARDERNMHVENDSALLLFVCASFQNQIPALTRKELKLYSSNFTMLWMDTNLIFAFCPSELQFFEKFRNTFAL